MRQRLSHILLDGDCGPVLLLLLLQFLFVGAWFLNPAWGTFESVVTFRAMSMIASEEYWGVWFLVMGLGLAWVALGVPAWRWHRVIVLLAAFTWYVVTAAVIYSNVATTASAIFALNALAVSWSYTRLHINGGC